MASAEPKSPLKTRGIATIQSDGELKKKKNRKISVKAFDALHGHNKEPKSSDASKNQDDIMDELIHFVTEHRRLSKKKSGEAACKAETEKATSSKKTKRAASRTKKNEKKVSSSKQQRRLSTSPSKRLLIEKDGPPPGLYESTASRRAVSRGRVDPVILQKEMDLVEQMRIQTRPRTPSKKHKEKKDEMAKPQSLRSKSPMKSSKAISKSRSQTPQKVRDTSMTSPSEVPSTKTSKTSRCRSKSSPETRKKVSSESKEKGHRQRVTTTTTSTSPSKRRMASPSKRRTSIPTRSKPRLTKSDLHVVPHDSTVLGPFLVSDDEESEYKESAPAEPTISRNVSKHVKTIRVQHNTNGETRRGDPPGYADSRSTTTSSMLAYDQRQPLRRRPQSMVVNRCSDDSFQSTLVQDSFRTKLASLTRDVLAELTHEGLIIGPTVDKPKQPCLPVLEKAKSDSTAGNSTSSSLDATESSTSSQNDDFDAKLEERANTTAAAASSSKPKRLRRIIRALTPGRIRVGATVPSQ